MALHFITEQAQKLLDEFEARVEQDKGEESVATWEKVVSNKITYLTHTAKGWARKAFFRPYVQADRLVFHMFAPKDKVIDEMVYAYYHGHLT